MIRLIEFMPKPDQARGVHIELDPKRIGLRYPVEVGLVGDRSNTPFSGVREKSKANA